MILSTTPQIEGHTIREYKGIKLPEHLHECPVVLRWRHLDMAHPHLLRPHILHHHQA